MRTKIIALLFCATTLLAPCLALAEEPGEPAKHKEMTGEELLEKSCMKCHKYEVYTAGLSKIKSAKILAEQVKACAVAAKTNWTDKQMMDVYEYLNVTYYKFK